MQFTHSLVVVLSGLTITTAALSAVAPGCHREAPPSKAPPSTQLDRGLVGFKNNCAGCHEPDVDGEASAPVLIGIGALPVEPAAGSERKVAIATAQDLFDFIEETMPPTAPGSLTHEEYWEIVAFLVQENGGKVPGDLGPAAAPSVRLPSRAPTHSVANPASAYCTAEGGTLEMRQAEGGTAGYCHLPDGRVVEEWELYRAAHPQP